MTSHPRATAYLHTLEPRKPLPPQTTRRFEAAMKLLGGSKWTGGSCNRRIRCSDYRRIGSIGFDVGTRSEWKLVWPRRDERNKRRCCGQSDEIIAPCASWVRTLGTRCPLKGTGVDAEAALGPPDAMDAIMANMIVMDNFQAHYDLSTFFAL